MSFSKVHKKGMGYAKEEKNDGEIKACSKEKKREKDSPYQKKERRESHTKKGEEEELRGLHALPVHEPALRC
jgi:hypothetical protein